MKCRVVKKCVYQSRIYNDGAIIDVDKNSFDYIKLTLKKCIEKYIPVVEEVKIEPVVEPVKKKGRKK